MSRRFLPLLPVWIVLAGLAFTSLEGCSTARTQIGGPPVLVINTPRVDLGDVSSGETIETVVLLQNTGGETLWIENVHASCGCTVPSWNQDRIEPGETAEMLVRIDTRGKAGPIRKTVTISSNDPASPTRELTFFFRANHPVHGNQSIETQSLFSSGCRSCHADRGAGQSGEPLFVADCAMCHREKEAAYSPGSPREILEMLEESELLEAIRDGVPESSMPAFGRNRGGPLDEEQLRSLIRYLKSAP